MSQTPIYDLPRFQVQCECLNNLVVEVKGLARYISHKDYLASVSRTDFRPLLQHKAECT